MAASKPTAVVLHGIEDTLALILDCSNNPAQVDTVLLPSLRKLCSPSKGSANASGSRNGIAQQQQQRGPAHGLEEVLCQTLQGEIDPLTVLDPAVHSLGMLYILAARVHHASNVTPQYAAAIFPHINAFIQRFTLAQIQSASGKITQLAAGVARISLSIQDPIAGLETIRALFDRFVTVPNNLTTLHPLLVYQYLRARKYADAVLLLDVPIIDADTAVTPLQTSDVLEYFYYSGLIYTKLERYIDAIDAFETCVSSPAVAVSAIQIDAYKKLVLVQLLAHGKTLPLPSYTPSVVARTYKQVAQPYLALVTAYESNNTPDSNSVSLSKLVQQRFEAFQQDRNWGLVQKCVSQHRQRRIQRLGDVYLVVSVARIASLLGLTADNAEQAVLDDLRTIASRHWMTDDQRSATLVERPDHTLEVHFSPSTADQTFDSAESAKMLNTRIQQAKQWQTQVQTRDGQLGRSTTYLTRAFKARDNRYATAGGGPSSASNVYTRSFMGEDLDDAEDDDDPDY